MKTTHKIIKALCDCPRHKDSARRYIGRHGYRCQQRMDVVDTPSYEMISWSWVCDCGSTGKWNHQSPNTTYHRWEQHVTNDPATDTKEGT